MSEVTNKDRSGWAEIAVNRYAEETRNDPREQTVNGETEEDREHAEEVIGDLLGDLRHLCDALGIYWGTVDRSGAMHHREEVAEEAHAKQTAAIMDLITPDPWGQAGGK